MKKINKVISKVPNDSSKSSGRTIKSNNVSPVADTIQASQPRV
ncbi:hypothetical protein BMETH_796_1 [methanotrophic bacterial endosymbiont of Bathymodiolus sp.]|nr:hypothetical protein BMETH_796_1 [methanotrophic bacterial endosymbiont of Bathymodiolus sp.]